MNQKFLSLAMVLIMCLAMTACSSTSDDTPSSSSGSNAPSSSSETPAPASSETPSSSTAQGENIAHLYVHMSSGSVDSPAIEHYHELAYSGELTVEILAGGLTELTGLDFFINSSEVSGSAVKVDWADNSTLIAGLDDRVQKEEFFVYDVDSLRWLMLDSLYQTIIANLGTDEVYYTQGGGNELVLEYLYPVSSFGIDIPYMGSGFYFMHDDVKGEDPDMTDISSYSGFWHRLGPDLDFGFDYIEIRSTQAFAYDDGGNLVDLGTCDYVEGRDPAIVIGLPDTGIFGAKYDVVDNRQVLDIAPIETWSDPSITSFVYEYPPQFALYAMEQGYVDDPSTYLMTILGDKMEGKAIMENGTEVIGTDECVTFSFGVNAPDRFQTEAHYAVSYGGFIYEMDIIEATWVPYLP